jgi:hypothetical protein
VGLPGFEPESIEPKATSLYQEPDQQEEDWPIPDEPNNPGERALNIMAFC